MLAIRRRSVQLRAFQRRCFLLGLFCMLSLDNPPNVRADFAANVGGSSDALPRTNQQLRKLSQPLGFVPLAIQAHRKVSPALAPTAKGLQFRSALRRSALPLWSTSTTDQLDPSPFDSVSDTAEVNDLLVERLLDLAQGDEWTQIADKKGVRVWRKRTEHGYSWPHGAGPANSTGRFDAIKAVAVLEAPMQTVVDVFRDNKKCQEYNEFFAEMEDVLVMDENTKIVWSATERIGPLRARDFATRVHFRPLSDGSYLIANLAEQVACADQRAGGKQSKYCRMEMLLGGHLIRPVAGSAGMCEYTQITHANPGGALDSKIGAFIANAAAAGGPVEVISSLRLLVAPSQPPPS